jgi:SAM-dependent methyltransferase
MSGVAGRLRTRRNRIWARSFLTYRYLWPHIEAAVRRARAEIRSREPVVLDVGCGERPYEDLFAGCTYWGLNYGTEHARPHLVGTALALPVRDCAVDLVFASQVIEHLPDPASFLAECARVLRPGGRVVVTGPLYWPLHEEPHDYFRFTRYGFAELVRRAGLDLIEVKEDGGNWAMIGQALALNLPGWLRPLVPVTNAVCLGLDTVDYRAGSTMNYTVLAGKAGTAEPPDEPGAARTRP